MTNQELDALVEELATRDWRRVEQIRQTLWGAGEPGRQAILNGMKHPSARVRRACVDYLDHFGDDTFVPRLIDTAQNDPVPMIRRMAVHSLSCDRCKFSPLSLDRIPLLLSILETETNDGVRGETIWALNSSAGDERVQAVLHKIKDTDTHLANRKAAHAALYHHDAKYRQAFVASQRANRTKQTAKTDD